MVGFAANFFWTRFSSESSVSTSDIPIQDSIGDLTMQLGSSLGNFASSAASRIQGVFSEPFPV
jgi:hypothetical protein